METPRHRLQLEILIRALEPWAAARGDVFVSGNQFVYFSASQLRGRDFRGPDVFVVSGVERRDQHGLLPLPEETQRRRADIAEAELDRLRAELAKLHKGTGGSGLES